MKHCDWLARCRLRGALRGVLATGILLVTVPATALVLDDERRIDVVLSDGTTVVLYGEAARSGAHGADRYYYLPVNLRLSSRPDGTPEFLFLKFTTEERAEAGGTSGALMHLLMEWGLTPEQEGELGRRLDEDHGGAELGGAVPMLPDGESGSYRVVSATLEDEQMTPAMVSSGKAPLVPGGKVATAARLDARGAQLLAATFEKARSITDVSIALDFTYATLTPAARGSVVFDWTRYEQHHDSIEAEYAKWVSGRKTKKVLGVTWWSKPTYSYSYDEMRNHFDYLMERQVVRLEFDELVADERVAAIRDAFFQYFLNAFAETASGEEEAPPPAGDEEKEAVPNIRYGNSYKFKKTFVERSFAKREQRFDLSYRMSIRRPHQLVGNLASWYDGVRDNPRCVAAVNLNDPFFAHRDIHFILDLDAKEIFAEAINYVTVNVRKRRSSGRPFEDRVTIDANYLREHGITATVTYARGDDTDTDVYDYRVQWSLRGGHVYPVDPPWQQGSWEGVTLSPPIVPRTLEVEGDLGELAASDVTRMTVQVHYPRFGEEVEENIHLSVARGEPLVTRTLFMDRDARGYAYRLVFNHKTEGKLALPWNAQVGDDYVYATIPEDFFAAPDLVEEAKATAQDLVRSAEEKVLDRFRELVGGP